MKISQFLRHSLSLMATMALALGPTQQTFAEDIDLYVGGESATGAQTNVLLILDNSTNWASASQHWPTGKQGESELEALAEVIDTLGDNVNLGLLMAAGSNGGYVRFAVREMSGTNKTAFRSMLSTMVTNFGNDGDNDDKVNAASIVYDNMLNAAFRYFNGKDRFGSTDLPSGSALDLRDYDGNSNSSSKQPAYPSALGSYSLANSSATTYTPPPSASAGCAKNFIIFIGNGYPNQSGSAAELTAAGALVSVTPDTTAVVGGSSHLADEWTRFMRAYGVKSVVDDPQSTTTPKAKLWNTINTYTIDVCKDACEADQAVLLKSMAKVGGGKYFKSTSKSEIKNALALIFAEIQSVNSVFASATLPVSVNAQGTYENQVYIGEFRPDPGARPRWYGNLKEYKYGRYCDVDGNGLVGVDSTRTLVNGMITSTLDTGSTAKGDVSGTFSGSITSATGVVTAVSGTVAGYAAGTRTTTLAASFGAAAGTTASPAESLGFGSVTGTISGTGTGTGTATFTGTLVANPSVSGKHSSSDERIGDNVFVGSECASGIKAGLYLADQNGYPAIDETGHTGFIDTRARSYWTSASTYWSAASNSTAGASDSPDGPEVERGAAAQRLRTQWAQTPTGTHPDGRKVYTCLGNCLSAGASDAARALSSNPVTTGNGEVTAALAAPTGSATVTLARSANTVTATSTAAHNFGDQATVTIAGATPTDYNGLKTITYVDATHFTYPLNEAPTITDNGTATRAGGVVNVTNMTLSTTTPGQVATVTVTAPGHGLNVNDVTTVANAAQSFLNGAKTVLTAPNGNEITFSVTLPANPTTPATVAGSSKAMNDQTATHSSISYTTTECKSGASAGCVVVLATANLGNKFVTGNTVVVSGVTPATYNTDAAGVSIQATGTSCPSTPSLTSDFIKDNKTKIYCYALAAQPAVVATDTGAGKTITSVGLSRAVSIARDYGSTTATATSVGHGFSSGNTISITGATQSQYNLSNVSITVLDADRFTYGPIAVTPSATATGTITATTGTGVAGPDTNNLILWTRGKDLWEDEDINASLTNVRASIHGDVLHSRPVIINYGSSTGVVGFYGSNDGFLRAVKGGLSVSDGVEKWAFLPEEAMSYTKLARLYTNSETIRYPNSSCSVSPAPRARDYVWDGSVTAYQTEDGTATTAPTKTWIFASMRRGGRALYGLDVSNPDTPKLLWRISNTKVNNTVSADYAELGQTWSEPKVIKLRGSSDPSSCPSGSGCRDVTKVALAFGAGYDATVEDKPTGSSRSVTMGRGVFITDAETGAKLNLLQSPSGQAYSFAAEVSPLDIDSDKYTDRIYAVDTGGNIYRFDADPTKTIGASNYWKRYVIARVGDYDNNGGLNARKFLFGPELLAFRKSGALQVGIFVGSGDREKPLANFTSTGCSGSQFKPKTLSCSALYPDTYFPPSASCASSSNYKVYDRFFGIFDTIETGTAEGSAPTAIEFDDLLQINNDSPSVNTLTAFALGSSYKGWNILLRRDPNGDGVRNEEKTVNKGLLNSGVLYFATNTPQAPNLSAGVCTNLGQACAYAVDPFSGLPKYKRTAVGTAESRTYDDYCSVFEGGGLPPSATSGFVNVGDETYAYLQGTGGTPPRPADWDIDQDGDIDEEDKKKIDELFDDKKKCSVSPLGGCLNDMTLTGTRSRLYWSYGAD